MQILRNVIQPMRQCDEGPGQQSLPKLTLCLGQGQGEAMVGVYQDLGDLNPRNVIPVRSRQQQRSQGLVGGRKDMQ